MVDVVVVNQLQMTRTKNDFAFYLRTGTLLLYVTFLQITLSPLSEATNKCVGSAVDYACRKQRIL